MSLRDTLRAASERAAEEARAEAEKPRIISEWQQTIIAFNRQVREWLSQYEKDGSIAIRDYSEDYHEEYLGSYAAQAMNISAGQYIVCIRPVGRIIFGAVGRIDMYRQGRGTEASAVRFIHLNDNGSLRWFIRKPQVKFHGTAVAAYPSEPEVLTSINFEAALDELLQQP